MNTQNVFYKSMSTPWGSINEYTHIAEGIISVSTPGHGGLWLSDERIAQLPEHYEPFTGTKRWAEEDEDAGLVLQYLGLLSLIPEPLTLEVTQADIEAGRESRKTAWYDTKQGGPIVEAYKRVTGDDCGEMLCHKYLSPKPGGFRLAKLCDTAIAFMQAFDAGEDVEPSTFILEPYTVYERVEFTLTDKDGKEWVDKVSGLIAKRILEGDKEAWDFYARIYVTDEIVKVTHEDKVIWERKPAGKKYSCIFSKSDSSIDDVMGGTVLVDTDDNILEAWDCDGFKFMWQGYEVEIIK